MAVILVTGSAGQLGSEIRAASVNYQGYEFVFTDIDALDITSEEAVKAAVDEINPDWIINCVAYNFVDKAETDKDTAFKVNSLAPGLLAEAARGSEAKLIHVSTDYVFDGMASVPYNENSPTNPQTVYGRSKLEGELNALRHHGTMVIRTAWLYSSYGKNFVKTIIKNGREKEELRVVFDQTGTPTYAADLAEAVLHIVSMVIRNQKTFIAGLYHYSNEGVCSWYDFAIAISEHAALPCDIVPVTSDKYKTAAVRPHYSVMDKEKIRKDLGISIPHWRESLSRCIEKLIKQEY